MLQLSHIQVLHLVRGVLDVTWEFSQSVESPDDYVVVLQRSVQQGAFYDVSGDVSFLRVFRDANTWSDTALEATTRYRLLVTHRGSGESAALPETGAGLEYPVDLTAAEIRRSFEVQTREFAGQKVALYQKRRSGTRCTLCYDARLQRRTKSNCSNCFDTTFVGGFLPPLWVWMQVVDQDSVTAQTPEYKTDRTTARFQIAVSPVVRPGDLVVDVPTGRRWEVAGRLRVGTLGRSPLHRSGTLVAVERKSVLNDVPLPVSAAELADMFFKPWRNLRLPKTI